MVLLVITVVSYLCASTIPSTDNYVSLQSLIEDSITSNTNSLERHIILSTTPTHSENLELRNEILCIQGDKSLTPLTFDDKISQEITNIPNHGKSDRHRKWMENSMLILENSTVIVQEMKIDVARQSKPERMESGRRRKQQNTEPLIARVKSSSLRLEGNTIHSSGSHSYIELESGRRSLSTIPSSVSLISCSIKTDGWRMTEIVKLGRHISNEGSGEVVLFGMSFSNVEVMKGGGVACDVWTHAPGSLFSLDSVLSHLHFSNASSPQIAQCRPGMAYSQRFLDSEVSTSNNHLSGTTIVDINFGGKLVCQNTTFKNCRTLSSERVPTSNLEFPSYPTADDLSAARVYSFTKQNQTLKHRYYVSETQSPHAHIHTLPALSDTYSDYYALFSSCSFENMEMVSVNRRDSSFFDGGAAIFICSGYEQVFIKDSRFVRCHARGFSSPRGGAVCVDAELGSVFVEKSSFSECSSFYGGSIFVFSLQLFVKDSDFLHNRAFQRGGAIDAILDDFLISGSKFTRNEANGVGGALRLLFYGDSTSLQSTKFEHNFAYGMPSSPFPGHDLSSYNDARLGAVITVEDVTTTHFNDAFVQSNDDKDLTSQFNHSSLQVDGEASDDDNCIDTPCQSLSRAVSLLGTFGSIKILKDTPLPSLSFFELSAAIRSSASSDSVSKPTLVPQNNSVSIYVKSLAAGQESSLSIDAIIFDLPSLDPHTTSLFTISNGLLSLASVEISGFEAESTASLISLVLSSRLVITASKFTSISTKGSGSVVSGTDIAFLKIELTEFYSCTSVENGGVLHLSFPDTTNSSSFLINAYFDDTCTCGNGRQGKFIFLESNKMWSLLSSTIATDGSFTIITNGTFEGSSFIGRMPLTQTEFSLFPILSSTVDAIYVSGYPNGNDETNCSADSPCASLERAMAFSFIDPDSTIHLTNDHYLTNQVAITSNTLTVRTREGSSTSAINFQQQAQIVISKGSLTLNTVHIGANDNMLMDSIIVVKSTDSPHVLTITNCSIGGRTLYNPLISIEQNNSAIVKDTTISLSPHLSPEPAFLHFSHVTGAQLTLTGVSFQHNSPDDQYHPDIVFEGPSNKDFATDSLILDNIDLDNQERGIWFLLKGSFKDAFVDESFAKVIDSGTAYSSFWGITQYESRSLVALYHKLKGIQPTFCFVGIPAAGAGTGTMADPFSTITDALNNLARFIPIIGDLSEGEEDISISQPTEIVGSEGKKPSISRAITFDVGNDLTLRNLQFTSATLPSFSLSCNLLTIESCDFHPSSSLPSGSRFIDDTDTDQLVILSSSFSSIPLSAPLSAPLISFYLQDYSTFTIDGSKTVTTFDSISGSSCLDVTTQGAFLLQFTHFTNCHAGSTDGGALHIEVTQSGVAEILSCLFHSCTAQNGGGIYVYMDQDDNVEDQLILSNVLDEPLSKMRFINCTASEHGNNIFIDNTGNRPDNAPKLDFDPISVGENDYVVYGLDESKNPVYTSPFTRKNNLTFLFLSDSGSDVNECSREEPCRTPSTSIQLLDLESGQSYFSVLIVTTSTWIAPFTIQIPNVELTIRSDDTSSSPQLPATIVLSNEVAEANLDPNLNGFVEIKSQVIFSSLSFALAQHTFPCPFLYVHESATISFVKVHVKEDLSQSNSQFGYSSFAEIYGLIYWEMGITFSEALDFGGKDPFIFSGQASYLSFTGNDHIQSSRLPQKGTFTALFLIDFQQDEDVTWRDMSFEGSGSNVSYLFASVRTTGRVTITSCSFSYFHHITASPSTDGGLIHVEDVKCVSIEHSSFTECSSTGNGGILFVNQGTSFRIRNSFFTSCSSEEHGGCCFISLSPSQDQWDFEFDATFTNCSCGEGKHGKWIHLTNFNFPPVLNAMEWPVQKNGLTLANTTLFTADVDQEGVASTIDLIDYIVIISSSTVYVSNSEIGSTSGSCGTTAKPCFPLDVGMSHFDADKDGTVLVMSETDFTGPLPDFEHSICIKSASTNKAKVTMKQSPAQNTPETKFETPGTLTLDSLLFCMIDDFLNANSLIINYQSNLIINNCDFKKIITDYAIIGMDGGHTEIKSTTFDGMSGKMKESRDFMVVSAELDSESSLTMDDVTIKSAELVDSPSSKYLGILVYLYQSGGTPTFSLTNLKFIEHAESTIQTLHFLTIYGEDLSGLIEIGDSRFAGSYDSETELSWLWAIETKGEEEEEKSLLYYLVGTNGPVGVSSDGENTDTCGYFDTLCLTLSHAVGLAFQKKTPPAVTIQGSVSVGASIAATKGLTIKGRTQDATMEFSNEWKLAMSGTTAVITLDTLEMAVTYTFTIDSILTLNTGADLTLNKVKITISAPQSKYFLELSASKLTLVEVTLNGQKKAFKRSLLMINDGVINIAKSSFENVQVDPTDDQLSPIILVSSAPSSFSIGSPSPAAQTKFSNCSGADKGGALSIEVLDASSSVSIVNTLFQNCKATTLGGAVALTFHTAVSSSQLVVSATFNNCSLTDPNENGQWMLIKAPTISGFVTREQWQETLKKMKRTEHMQMIWCESLTSDPIESISLLDILMPATSASEIFVNNGSSFTGTECGGTQETACKTIDSALLQMKEEETEIVIVGEGSLGEGVGAYGGYFGLRGESSSKTQLKVNGKWFGQTDGIIAGLQSAELGLNNLRMAEIASVDGQSGYLVFLSDSSLSIGGCTMEASESLGMVHGTGKSMVEVSELTMKGTRFGSSVFLLVDESSISLSDSTWTQLRTSTGSLVDVSGWMDSNIEVSGMTISDCVSTDTTKALFEIGLSAWTERDRRQILIKGSTFAGSALSSPFVHVTGNGVGFELRLISTTMKWTGWTTGSSSRTGMMIEWTERQPLILRRGLKMEDCALILKKL